MNKTLQAKRIGAIDVDTRQLDADNAQGGVVNMNMLLRTLWRGKFVIVFLTSLAVLAGGYYAYVGATPKFKSTAVVMLNTQQQQVVDIESVVSGLPADSSAIATEVQVLQSRSLLGKVVDELKLVEDVEFNPMLAEDNMLDFVKDQVIEAIGLERAAPSSDDAVRLMRQRNATIDGLLEIITIRNVPLSLVFQVTVETTDPRKSAAIADTIVELYILNQLEVKFDATEQATKWLSERVAELQVSLETAESTAKSFRAGTDLVSPEALTSLEVQLKDLRTRISDTEVVREISFERVQSLAALQTPQEKLEATNDPQLQRLISRIEQEGIITLFDTRFSQIVARANLELQRSETQIAALSTSQVELQRQIDSQSADLIELQQLTREAEASRLLYEYFLSRLKETSAQQGVQQADSRVLSDAVIPGFPASPRKPLLLAVSFLIGFMLSSGIVLLREARKNTFRAADELERITNYPVIGQLPLLPIRKRKDALSYLAEKPTSAAAEAVRNLRTSVLLSNVDTPPQVIMTCSSFPGEGKTTVALALAQNMSKMGKKVLLVEGDVRRRVFGQYMRHENAKGLVSVLSEGSLLEDVVVREDRVGCDVLLADTSTENAADLFSSLKFAELLQKAREQYDHVIIDTPPVLVVPDARIISQNTDAIVFVVHWDKTIKPAVIDALRQFESVNTQVSGLVLNQISLRGMRRYGYGDKYGTYSAYGSKYYTN
ncbi:MAG: polysaccharide biosynthesis tyrosine autokinase [Aliishimia sp.]